MIVREVALMYDSIFDSLRSDWVIYLADAPSFGQGADSPHVGRSSPAAEKAAPSEEMKFVLFLFIIWLKGYRWAHVVHSYPDSQEEVHGVTSLLDEVLTILHELFQRHHGVVVDIEFVVSWPRLHGNQHNAGIKLLLENLWNQAWLKSDNNNKPWPHIKTSEIIMNNRNNEKYKENVS